MYTGFFGLAEKPFTITPDPRFLFLSERHSEALAHLLYGLEEAGGFTQLTGEVGTGKTTLIRSLLTRLPAHVEVALVLNPRLSCVEFVRTILKELAIPVSDTESSIPVMVDRLNEYLLKAHGAGRRVVVLVDEAQQLPIEVLEQVRLLTNLETTSAKLLQIILVGQPELRDVLARDDLRQLAQRITTRTHLDPLTPDESLTYIRHRLAIAGATTEIFSPRALKFLVRAGQGIPRLINVIADRALLGAFAKDAHQVDIQLVRQAVFEVAGNTDSVLSRRWLIGLAAAAVALSIILAWHQLKPRPPKPTAPTVNLVDFLHAHGNETGTDSAFDSLFQRWNLRFNPKGAKPCQQAAQVGLQCVADRGTLAQLRRINRPVILSLVDAESREYQVVLSGLSAGWVNIQAGKSLLSVREEELSPIWFGDFLLLWRPPVADLKNILPGQQGSEITWLRQAVAAALHQPPTPGTDIYDRNLQMLVQSFQKSYHLNVDGIVGPETQMLLDAAIPNSTAPRLAPESH